MMTDFKNKFCLSVYTCVLFLLLYNTTSVSNAAIANISNDVATEYNEISHQSTLKNKQSFKNLNHGDKKDKRLTSKKKAEITPKYILFEPTLDEPFNDQQIDFYQLIKEIEKQEEDIDTTDTRTPRQQTAKSLEGVDSFSLLTMKIDQSIYKLSDQFILSIKTELNDLLNNLYFSKFVQNNITAYEQEDYFDHFTLDQTDTAVHTNTPGQNPQDKTAPKSLLAFIKDFFNVTTLIYFFAFILALSIFNFLIRFLLFRKFNQSIDNK